MKIAIVHEMLIKLWGAERVLEELMWLFPEAHVYTFMYNEKKVWKVFPREKIIYKTLAQLCYKVTRFPRASLPFMAFSAWQIDLSGYDLVISSSSWFAHSIRTGQARHICYCHSPARYLWDWTDEVQKEIGVSKDGGKGGKRVISFLKKYIAWPGVRILFSLLRKRDLRASKKPDLYIANSGEVQWRIKKYYHRESVVLWPPVNTSRFEVGDTLVSQRDFYVITSALTPFKNIDRMIRVCNSLKLPLHIIGSGAQEPFLREIAWPTITFLGRLSDEEVVRVYRQARAFLMPQKEDAGIAPIEAMSAGIPVFWLAEWGLLEVNIDGVTGRFFPEETDESCAKNLQIFHEEIQEGKYDHPEIIWKQAEKFDEKYFREDFLKLIPG